MELPAKIVDCIQPLTIFAKHFILGVSQGYEYTSDTAKQNPGELSLITPKIKQGSANCVHGDERAPNVHAKSFSQSKHLK